MRIEETNFEVLTMDTENKDKKFSANFFSLQLQFKALLEEAGGDDLMPFLDTIAKLNKSEQKVALKIFSKVIKQVLGGPVRLETQGDLALKEFEDTLYEDLVAAIEEEKKYRGVSRPKSKIEVISGGKTKEPSEADKTPIDLAHARRKRRDRRPSFIN